MLDRIFTVLDVYFRETVRCRGLTIITDIRGCTTSTINTLLESLYLFEVRDISAISLCERGVNDCII